MTTVQRQLREKALSLTPDERLALAQALWDSLDADQASLPLGAGHASIIDERLASHEADPTAVVTWEQTKEHVRQEVSRRIREEQE